MTLSNAGAVHIRQVDNRATLCGDRSLQICPDGAERCGARFWMIRTDALIVAWLVNPGVARIYELPSRTEALQGVTQCVPVVCKLPGREVDAVDHGVAALERRAGGGPVEDIALDHVRAYVPVRGFQASPTPRAPYGPQAAAPRAYVPVRGL